MTTAPRMQVEPGGKRAVLEIFDLIGPSWLGMIDARTVAAALEEAGAVPTFRVLINSRGGDAFEAVGIHNLLVNHGAEIEVEIVGIAASAASLIAMAGDRITIPKNGMMMIHDPAIGAFGGERELKAALANLMSTKKSAVSTYAAKTGLSEDVIAQMMSDETWMTGEEAVAKKFATHLAEDVSIPATNGPALSAVPPFITKAPAQFSRLVAMCATVPQEPPVMTTPAPSTPPATPAPVAAATPAPEAAPAVVAPAAPLLTAADVTKAAADAVAGERTRISEITSMCKLAGHPEMAQKHIDDGAKPADVQTALFGILVAERPAVGSTGSPEMKTGDDKYKAEYAAQRDVYLAQGIDEQRYINGRRKDEGLPPLTATK